MRPIWELLRSSINRDLYLIGWLEVVVRGEQYWLLLLGGSEND